MLKILGLLVVATVCCSAIAPQPSPPAQEATTFTTCPAQCHCTPGENDLRIYDCQKPLILTKNFSSWNNKLYAINFKNVTIEHIDWDTFNELPNIETIAIEDSVIHNFDTKAFAQSEITILSFSGSTFNKIPQISSEDLDEVIFSNCNLGKVPPLDQMLYASLVHLDGNKISEISVSDFSNLEHLEEINLAHNNLTSIPENLFFNNSFLNSVYFDNNPLKHFSVNLPSNLELLSLSNCKLTVFNSTLLENSSLTYLDISNNSISKFRAANMRNMPKLNYINLSGNGLTVLEKNVFAQNSALEKIVLDNNMFETLPAFETSNAIFSTYLFSCRNSGLRRMDRDTFKQMSGLIEILLSHNSLTSIDDVLKPVSSLKVLDISYNNINRFGVDAFSGNTRLQEINLSGNPITTLNPEVFIHLSYLNKITAIHTGLRTLWSSQQYKFKNLEQIRISNNVIQNIDDETLDVTPNLKLLDVQNNPLTCDVNFENGIKWLIQKKIYSEEGSDLLKVNERMTLQRDADSAFEIKYDPIKHWKALARDVCGQTGELDQNILMERQEILTRVMAEGSRVSDKDLPIVQAPHEEKIKEKQIPSTTESDDDLDDEDDDILIDLDNEDAFVDERKDLDDSTKQFIADDFVANEMIINPNGGLSLNEASYILSITSIFILTAIVVLSIAVTVILFVLKRHRVIDRDNLPHFKIPRWDIPSHKKHSGSVYKSLSEEYLVPKTHRYDFTANPTVHIIKS